MIGRYASYPEGAESGRAHIGKVPIHWRISRLKFVADLNPSKAELNGLPPETAVSFLPMEAIGEDGIINTGGRRELSEVRAGYTYVAESDVVVAKITPCFENGKGGICRGLINGIGFATTEVIPLRPNKHLQAAFLHYMLGCDPFRKLAEGSMYGAGGQKRVPDQFVSNYAAALPGTEEQQIITAFLDHETAKIDTLIARQERLIALLKEKRQAVISHAVTKGLGTDVPMKDSGVEWLGEVPEHWKGSYKLVNLSDDSRGSFVNGPFGSDLLSSELVQEGVPVIYIRDVKPTGYYRKSTYCVTDEKAVQLEVCRVQSSDVLVAKVGDPPGDACVYPPGEPDAIITQDVVRIRTSRDKCMPEFLVYILNSTYGRSAVDVISVESTRKRFSLGGYKQLRVPLPPLEEQKKIVADVKEKLEKFDLVMNKAHKSIELMRERRTALISAAVTGKIDVRGWKPDNQ